MIEFRSEKSNFTEKLPQRGKNKWCIDPEIWEGVIKDRHGKTNAIHERLAISTLHRTRGHDLLESITFQVVHFKTRTIDRAQTLFDFLLKVV